jgi:hypothetical protein
MDENLRPSFDPHSFSYYLTEQLRFVTKNKILAGRNEVEVDDRVFKSRQGLQIFLFTTASRPALGPTQPPIRWVPGALSLGIKRPGREADHSPPSSTEVKHAWSYTSTPPIRFHGVLSEGISTILPFTFSRRELLESNHFDN